MKQTNTASTRIMIAHSNSLTGLPFEGSQTTKHFRISAVVRSLAKSVDMFATSDETQRGKGRAAYTRVSRTIVEPRPTLVGKVEPSNTDCR
ncbi:hypothetical protein K443DRAFT_675141 [Laccaria amethystina LaAM-08-1]|uniref:Uncharacterized protein n=1 Tax=Laccaria amethystina LaAM-08-1 TaxID=1095629 RepID=A0A0C9X0I9_9AGAR|nr:hypothetical protein K443DRAFT_675141 [Laccaria amethystina LaAM-08-1]